MKPALLGGIACGFNFGLLAFNGCFTNAAAIAEGNPDMFSPFGQLMILVWGLVFLAAGLSEAGSIVWFAFAAEKLCYAVGWLRWMAANPDAWSHVTAAWSSGGGAVNAIPHLFHVVYGPGDALFMLAFLHQALAGKPKRE